MCAERQNRTRIMGWLRLAARQVRLINDRGEARRSRLVGLDEGDDQGFGAEVFLRRGLDLFERD